MVIDAALVFLFLLNHVQSNLGVNLLGHALLGSLTNILNVHRT